MKEVSSPLSYAISPSSQPLARRIGPTGCGHLIASIGSIPVAVDTARNEPAADQGAERSDRHLTGAVGIFAQIRRAAQIKMVARPSSARHDPPRGDEAGARGASPGLQQPRKAKRIRASPCNRVLRCSAADFTQRNTSSIRFRTRILERYPGWRVVRPLIAGRQPFIFPATR